MRTVRSIQTFTALRERNFRLIWVSTLFSGAGQQMEAIVLAWYVLTLTDSPFLVGLVTTARQAATILGAYSGAIADRVSRRAIIIAVQGIMASFAAVMAVLVVTDLIEVWHIFAATGLTGLARIFDQPARQALVADSVPTERVANAVALNTVGRSSMQIAAPIAGGVLFALIGPAGSYATLALIYLSGIVAIYFIKTRPLAPIPAGTSIWRTMVQGLSYVRRNNILLAALLMAAIANLTAFPFNYALMPVYAKDVLSTDSTGLGFLLSGIGIGALIGSVAVASMPSMRYAGRLGIGMLTGWHVMTAVVIFTPLFQVSFGFLIVAGIMQSMSLVLVATMLLGIAAPEYRGRVMGLRSLAVYTLPFGSFVSGALVNAIGLGTTAIVNSAVGGVLILLIVIFIPSIWRPQEVRTGE